MRKGGEGLFQRLWFTMVRRVWDIAEKFTGQQLRKRGDGEG